jgi:hypothetical protein
MTEARKPLNIHKIQIQDCLATMAEGNIGALNVLMALLKRDFNGFVAILDLDDMNMRVSRSGLLSNTIVISRSPS